MRHGRASNSQQTRDRIVSLSVCQVERKKAFKSQVCFLSNCNSVCFCVQVCIFYIADYKFCVCALCRQCVHAVVHRVTPPFNFFMVFSSLIENMTGCSRGLMDGAGELRKPLALLESQPVKQSIHTALCVCKQRWNNYPFY